MCLDVVKEVAGLFEDNSYANRLCDQKEFLKVDGKPIQIMSKKGLVELTPIVMTKDKFEKTLIGNFLPHINAKIIDEWNKNQINVEELLHEQYLINFTKEKYTDNAAEVNRTHIILQIVEGLVKHNDIAGSLNGKLDQENKILFSLRTLT